MGKVTITASVSVSGPIADGTAHKAVQDWLNASKKDVADYAERQLRATVMDKTGRATGRYQSEIRQSLIGYGDVLVHDPVVYGPWLEGVSERNRSTRFKGYQLWRKAKQSAQRQAGPIAEKRLPEFAERIGISR